MRFYLRKDAFQASSRFDVEHGFKAQTTVAFQRSLEGPVEASTAVDGSHSHRSRDRQKTQVVAIGCCRSCCQLVQDWLPHRLGLSPVTWGWAAFVLCPPYHKRHETVRLETALVYRQKLQR